MGRLSRAQIRQEWRQSRAALGDILGEPPDTASVPGGFVSRDVVREAAAAGYRALMTSEPRAGPRLREGSLPTAALPSGRRRRRSGRQPTPPASDRPSCGSGWNGRRRTSRSGEIPPRIRPCAVSGRGFPRREPYARPTAERPAIMTRFVVPLGLPPPCPAREPAPFSIAAAFSSSPSPSPRLTPRPDMRQTARSARGMPRPVDRTRGRAARRGRSERFSGWPTRSGPGRPAASSVGRTSET